MADEYPDLPELPEEPEPHDSYHDKRDEAYADAEDNHKRRTDPDHQETQAELAAVLNREDELETTDDNWNTTYHEVTVVFRWSEISRFSESAMEFIEMVDEDPIGTAIDAYLEPHYDSDTFEVIAKAHRVEYEDNT
jgi:hypothetical protein